MQSSGSSGQARPARKPIATNNTATATVRTTRRRWCVEISNSASSAVWYGRSCHPGDRSRSGRLLPVVTDAGRPDRSPPMRATADRSPLPQARSQRRECHRTTGKSDAWWRRRHRLTIHRLEEPSGPPAIHDESPVGVPSPPPPRSPGSGFERHGPRCAAYAISVARHSTDLKFSDKRSRVVAITLGWCRRQLP